VDQNARQGLGHGRVGYDFVCAKGASFLSPGQRPGKTSVEIPRADGARYRGAPGNTKPSRGPTGRRSNGDDVPSRWVGLGDDGPLGQVGGSLISTTSPVPSARG
jgi:hypothetical protein